MCKKFLKCYILLIIQMYFSWFILDLNVISLYILRNGKHIISQYLSLKNALFYFADDILSYSEILKTYAEDGNCLVINKMIGII